MKVFDKIKLDAIAPAYGNTQGELLFMECTFKLLYMRLTSQQLLLVGISFSFKLNVQYRTVLKYIKTLYGVVIQ